MANYFVVSIDFDGVLAHGISAKIKYAKKWFGVDLRFSETKKEGFESLMKKIGKTVTYRDLMDRLNEEHIMEYLAPDNCVNVLSSLFREGYRFAVVTSRNEHDFPYAVKFITENLSQYNVYFFKTTYLRYSPPQVSRNLRSLIFRLSIVN